MSWSATKRSYVFTVGEVEHRAGPGRDGELGPEVRRAASSRYGISWLEG